MNTITDEREKYIGGSDIPAILNLSAFKTRWQLLLEKAELSESDFEGNVYTEYGNTMEPLIREHINKVYQTEYKPATKISGDLRGNTDGYDGKSILEIKTTSRDIESLEDCKDYLAQILFYMTMYKVRKGILAVYTRPDDFSEEFEAERLNTFSVDMDEHSEFMAFILSELQIFRDDLEYLKDYPLSEEADLPSRHGLVPYINTVVTIETRLAEYKALEKEFDEAKAKLLQEMLEHNVKVWTTPSGIRITAVPPGDNKIVRKLNEKRLKEEQPEVWEDYAEDKVQKGKAGYVRITYPKA